MGVNSKHMLGRDLRFYAVPETSTYNPSLTTYTAPAGTDALKVLSSSMDFSQERVDRADARETRSLLERITRRKEISWACESYIIPRGSVTAGATLARRSGSAGNDYHVLLRSALGTSVSDGASGTRYDLTSTQSLPTTTLFRTASTVGMEMITGAFVNEFSISGSGGDEPKMSWSGNGSKYVFTGTAVAAGATFSTTQFTMSVDNSYNFEVGSLVQSLDADGTTVKGDGIVSVVARGVITVASVTTAFAAGDTIRPLQITPSVNAAAPLNGITGSLALTGPTATALPITTFEMTVANNIKAINDEAFTDSITDFVTGYRNVTGSLSVRARADQMKEIILRKTFEQRDIAITIGSGTGTSVVIDMNQVEFDFSAIEIPEAEEATFELPFTALGSSGDDEMTLTFT